MRTNTYAVGVSERGTWREAFEEMMADNFLNLMKAIKPQSQESQ